MNRSRYLSGRRIMPGILAATLLIALPFYSATGQSDTSKSPASGSSANQLPDGPGKDVVLKNCQSCHSLQNVTSHRGNADDWAQVVSQMIGRGANISDEDADTIVNYLAAHFGPNSPKHAESSSSPHVQESASDNATQSASSGDQSSGSSNTIDVNKSSAAKLQADLGLPKIQADAIVHYRDTNGVFKNLEQLLAVPGVDSAKLKNEQNKIRF